MPALNSVCCILILTTHLGALLTKQAILTTPPRVLSKVGASLPALCGADGSSRAPHRRALGLLGAHLGILGLALGQRLGFERGHDEVRQLGAGWLAVGCVQG